MVGERLQAAVRAGDLVARLGGDEFVVVQTSGTSNEKAMAARLLGCLERSFSIRGDAVRIGCSLGLAVAPRNGATLDQLVAAADGALYEAKAAGRNLWRAARTRGRARRVEAPAAAACSGRRETMAATISIPGRDSTQ
jgi:diguanylate cyclase (GGDEF)-like protein